MAGGTGLHQATLIVYAELATVDIAEVDLHPREFAGKPLQEPIHLASDKLNHSRIDVYVFVAVDLNPHAFPLFPASTGGRS